METLGVGLTAAEWQGMECLWEHAPQTMTQLARPLSAREGWAKGTTTTVLRRMTDKGLLACTQEGRARQYAPAVDRRAAVVGETRSFLRRVGRGSVELLMSAAAQPEELSQEELDALYDILKGLEESRHD